MRHPANRLKKESKKRHQEHRDSLREYFWWSDSGTSAVNRIQKPKQTEAGAQPAPNDIRSGFEDCAVTKTEAEKNAKLPQPGDPTILTPKADAETALFDPALTENSFPTAQERAGAEPQAPAVEGGTVKPESRKRRELSAEQIAAQNELNFQARNKLQQLLTSGGWDREALAQELDVTASYIGLVLNKKTGVAPWFLNALSALLEEEPHLRAKEGLSMLKVLRRFPRQDRPKIEQLGADFLTSLLHSSLRKGPKENK